MPRTKPAEERRSDLLAAGQALFVEKGVAATTLEDITSRAGVSKGLFYQYFHSKEDLVAVLQERFSAAFADRLGVAVGKVAGWPEKLDAAIRECFESFRREHELDEVLFRHSGHSPGEPGESPAHQPLAEAIRALLAAGVAAGAYRVDDVDSTTLLLVGALHAFDPGFRGADGPTDSRLVLATQQLARRVAGIDAPVPPQNHPQVM
jgi:TetR/AcrR family transcriptional repressor of nem operon